MIDFEEFCVDYDEKDGLKQTVDRVNEWLKKNEVQVINMETIVMTIGGGMVSVDQAIVGLRIWYRRI